MPYIEAATMDYPLSVEQVAFRFPAVSFSQDPASRDNEFAARGYYLVVAAPMPDYDAATHRVVQHSVPTLVDGVWVLGWDVVALTQQEFDIVLQDWRQVTSVTPRQMRLALLDLGLLDAVEQMVAQSPRNIQVEWEYSTIYERNNPAWEQLGAHMVPPLSPADIDNIFKRAQAVA